MQSAVPHSADSEELINHGRREKASRSPTDSDLTTGLRATERIARLLNQFLFASLLTVIIIAAIPYGTVEPWWKAAFVCLVFSLWILGTIEDLLSPLRKGLDKWLFMPLFALVAFALLQSFPLGVRSHPAIPQQVWNAISADPYQTQFFASQLLAITFVGALLSRYVTSDRRLRALIIAVIAVAVMSAIFGVVRQTNQHGLGFGLPLLSPGRGYGQFINPNHFALLMEMAFGLILGIVLASNTKREGLLVYGAMLLIVWTALVLANSRGGLLTMMVQILAAGLLHTAVVPASKASGMRRRVSAALRSLPARILLLVVLLLGVVAGTLWIGGDRLASRFEDLSGGVNSAETRSGGSRNEIWRATWLMFKANPIAGVGLGGYWAAITEYHDASGSLTPQEAHNDYLELLASGGIVGACLGGWFLLVLGRRIRSHIPSSNSFRRGARFGALLGIIGVLTHSLFDFGLHMLVNAFVFAALIVIATSDTHSEHRLRRSNA
ncbi:MAG TPA: O-antigen ligase family protein [Pyrinomonadaceae bacterium]|nr:O-antigen ligase family protein [Pyrinomonadaceae bacterium]